MKLCCEKHGTYHHVDDWLCPECAQDTQLLVDEVREKVMIELLARLPDSDQEEWNDKERIETMIRESIQTVAQNQSTYNCMFYYEHRTKKLDVSLIISLDPIMLASEDGSR